MMRWRQRGLRFNLSLGISLILLAILGVSFVVAAGYIRNQLWLRETQAASNLNAMAATLLEDAMMVGRKDQIQQAIEALGTSVGGQIDSIAIYDDDAILTAFATGFPGGRNIQRQSVDVGVNDPSCWGCHQLAPQDRPSLIVVELEGKQVVRNVVPLYNEPRCQTCHGTGQAVLGDSIVDIEMDQYKRAVTTVILGLGSGITITIGLVIFALYQLLQRVVLRPLEGLVDVTQSVVQGDLRQEVDIVAEDEVGKLGIAFNTMTRQLRELVTNLESRVQERTMDLEQRTAYLEASAEISRRAAIVLDPNVLIQQIVDLIKEQFGLYYVGLFLVDKNQEWAVLRAGTGKEGAAMLASQHRLKIGEGMIGWCISNAQARIAQDEGEDAVRFNNPFLPETHTEGAIPMRSRGRVLGALTVQSRMAAAFNQDTITVFQTMADQIATALDNAQLFAESQAALKAQRRAYGELTRQGWQNLLQARPDLVAFVSQQSAIQPVPQTWSPDMVTASQNGQIVRSDDKTIAIPIVLRDQVLGVVRLRKNESDGKWTDEEIGLMDTLVDQLESALETARLYEDTQKAAARERLVTEISSKIRASNDPQEMLQTAVLELRTALQAHRAQIVFNPPSSTLQADDDVPEFKPILE